MTSVIILSVICTLLVLLLIITTAMIFSYRREIKSYSFLSELEKQIRINTSAIRDLCEESRHDSITLNIESLIKEYKSSNDSINDEDVINVFKRILDNVKC